MKPQPAGYSGTPLIKKIGIKEGHRVALYAPPHEFKDLLGPLPQDAQYVNPGEDTLDVVLLFVVEVQTLAEEFPRFQARLAPKGMIWVAWPKKSSGVHTDLHFTPVQEIGLSSGLVDVKVCAIDETWSGLKFLRRRVQKT